MFDSDWSIRVYRSFHYCMNIMLGNYYSVDTIFNALPTFTVTEILGVSQILLLHMCVLATLATQIFVYSLYLEKNLYPRSHFILGHVSVKVNTLYFNIDLFKL